MFIAKLSTNNPAPAERYVGSNTLHSAGVQEWGIPLSINIALRWSTVFSPVSQI